MSPSSCPARTLFGSVGATAIALTRPAGASAWLAWVQLPAPLSVRHMKRPPVHKRWGSLGSIRNGEMNRPLSLIPEFALKKLAPPSVDFWIVRSVFSA